MEIFWHQNLGSFLEGVLREAISEIEGEDKNSLLNCNEVSYIQYLIAKYRIEPLHFEVSKMYLSDAEKEFRIEDFGQPQIIKRQVFTYHIPFSGNNNLLHCRPSNRLMWTKDVHIDCCIGEISFDIVNLSDNLESIKKEAAKTVENLQKQLDYVLQEITQFHNIIEDRLTESFKSRKNKLLKQSNMLAGLGIPVKETPKVPRTFAISSPKERPIIIKPVSLKEPYSPEPTLDNSTYTRILEICHDVGIEIERHPSIYQGKDEETLRDHFLMVLSPHFQSTTSETFNKTGKTDILIRHEGKNVFVAECKFWGGIKAFHETIDQILSYLTWRDSKAAILCFVKNKQLDPVLKEIDTNTSKHSCFVKYYGAVQEGWFRFNFHLKDDNTRGIELAVLCFHFPE